MRTALIILCATLATLVIAILATLAVLGAQQRRRRLREPLLEAARCELVRTVAAGSSTIESSGPDEATGCLAATSRRELRDLLLDVGSSLTGGSLLLLRDIGESGGVLAQARTMLRSRRWSRRLVAARVLSGLGERDSAADFLLNDPHPAVRAQAATWLGGDATMSEPEAIFDLLADSDGIVRFAAKTALMRRNDTVRTHVGRRLANAEGVELLGLLEVAAAIPGRDVAEAAAALTSHPSPHVRALCAAVLAASAGPALSEEIEPLLDDDDPDVRRAAVAALGDADQWQTAPRLARLLHDPERRVRNEAARALLKLDGVGVLLLLETARRDDGTASDLAAKALDLFDHDVEIATR